MHTVAPGVAIHTPAGGFDDLVPQQRSAQVGEKVPSIIDQFNAELREINVALDAAREGMNDPEHPESVRAHFKRLYNQFIVARRNLEKIKAEWRKSAPDKTLFPDTWTAANIATLRKLFADGASNEEIAKVIGITANAVRHKLSKLKLERKPLKDPNEEWWTEDRLIILRMRFAEGAGPTEIGREIGCTRNVVRGKINKLKLTREKQIFWTEDKDKLLRSWFAADYTPRMISRELDCSYDKVIRRIIKLGLRQQRLDAAA